MKTTAPNPDWPKVVCCWFAFRIKRAKKFQHLDLKCFRVMVCIDYFPFQFLYFNSSTYHKICNENTSCNAQLHIPLYFFVGLPFFSFFLLQIFAFSKKVQVPSGKMLKTLLQLTFNRFEILVGTQNKTFVLQTFANSSKDLRPSELC